MGEPLTSVRRIKAVEKQRQALELRKTGESYFKIAVILGYASKSGAYKAVITALKKTLREPAEDLRLLELERLDSALSSLWPFLKGGNLGAIDKLIKIEERRAKLLGLDAPTKADITSAGALKVVIEYADQNNTPETPPSPTPDQAGTPEV